MGSYKKHRERVEHSVDSGGCYLRIFGKWFFCGFCFESEVDDADLIAFLDRYYLNDRVLPARLHNRNAVDFVAMSYDERRQGENTHSEMLSTCGGEPSMHYSGIWTYPGNNLGSAVSPGMSEFLTLYHDGKELREDPVDTPAANEACARIHAHNVRNGWTTHDVEVGGKRRYFSYTYISRRGAMHIYSQPMRHYLARVSA